MHMDYDLRIKKIMDGNQEEYKKVLTLLNALRKELAHFDYEGNHQKLSHFLIKINKIRPGLSAKKQKVIDGEITKLHQKVREILKRRPENISKSNYNFLELKEIINNLEGMNLSYMYNFIDKYDGNAYNLIRYLLFEEKNLFFVKYALEKYPHLINIRDDQNKSLIIEVVEKYVEAIDVYIKSGLCYSDDVFFYDQVLENMLMNKTIDYNEETMEQALAIVDKFLNNYDYQSISMEAKNKLAFWSNELKNKLEELHPNETLAHLSYKTDVVVDFNEAVLSEARRFNVASLRKEAQRRELNNDEYIITVDDETAEEIDDGLSARRLPNGNYLLGVHISDPSGYISKNNILYDEAYRRTTSIYSPLERTSSMFPEAHAKDYMSLTEGENRFSTSYYIEITDTGEIILDSCVFKKTITNVNKKMTYESFNDLANRGCDDPRLEETIINLQEIVNILSKRIHIDERYRLANREVKNASGTNVTGTSSSEKIIEYAMIAANSTVANYAAKKGFPFIYRGHELSKDYLEKIDYFDQKFRDNPNNENYDVFVKMLRDTYPTAFYTTDSTIGHMGIGLPHYSHLTSPLRRFADCLANEALDLFYFNTWPSDKKIVEFEKRLQEGCKYINNKKKTIDYFTKRYTKIKNN